MCDASLFIFQEDKMNVINGKPVIEHGFKVFKAMNPANNTEIVVIGMENVDYDEQLDILSYLRKKQYQLKIDFNIVILEFEDEVYLFDFNEKKYKLPKGQVAIIFDFIQEDGKFKKEIKTIIEITN